MSDEAFYLRKHQNARGPLLEELAASGARPAKVAPSTRPLSSQGLLSKLVGALTKHQYCVTSCRRTI